MMNIEEERQEIKNQHVNPLELNLHPGETRQFDVGNRFERRLSYLVAYDGLNFHLLKAGKNGMLEVISYPPAFEKYVVQRTTLSEEGTTELKIEGEEYIKRVDIYVYDTDVYLQFAQGIFQQYGDQIKIHPGFYSYDFLTTKVKLSLTEAGGSTEVQIVAWY